MQCAPITHEEGSTWPHCHTFVFILGNLSLPVVISEWHMVEVLTRFKHIRQAGIDAIHGGSRAVLRERKSPPIGLETKLGQRVCNTAALLSHSVTSSLGENSAMPKRDPDSPRA